MTLTLTKDKKDKIINLCVKAIKNNTSSNREVAILLRNLTAALEAIPLGKLHYRELESQKIHELKINKGNFEAKMQLNTASIGNIKWWINNTSQAVRNLDQKPIDYIIFTDASEKGWGATDNAISIGGPWDKSELGLHINILEMKAVELSMLALLKNREVANVQLMIDNTTAIAYINNMGGAKSKECNAIAQNIWKIAQDKGIWLTANHIPGKNNILADFKSRHFDMSAEWTITKFVFDKILLQFGEPNIDMFATRLNTKLSDYISWKPDPYAKAIDAFAYTWTMTFPYCFPPFSIIGKVLKKIVEDKVEKAIMVVPLWPTQPWFPTFLKLMVSTPIMFRSSRKYLKHPQHQETQHPLAPKLKFLVALLSHQSTQYQACQKKQQILYSDHGPVELAKNMNIPIRNGNSFVLNGEKISLHHI